MTAQTPAEELRKLRAEVAQFRRVCDAVPVAIAYYERSGNICRYANQGYAEMFGFTQDSILGHTVAEVIGSEAAQAIAPRVDQILRELRSSRYERQIPLPRALHLALQPICKHGQHRAGVFFMRKMPQPVHLAQIGLGQEPCGIKADLWRHQPVARICHQKRGHLQPGRACHQPVNPPRGHHPQRSVNMGRAPHKRQILRDPGFVET